MTSPATAARVLLPPDNSPASSRPFARAKYARFRQLSYEFAKFAVIGVTGMVITNAVYDLLSARLGIEPVTATTIATIAAAIATYLGNRSWSFGTRQRTGVVREIIIFAVLNGIGPLIQDATVAFNSCLLGLGHGKLAGLIALSSGIALATLFRFGPIGGSSGSPGRRRECQAARTGLGSVCGSFTPVRSRSPAVGQHSSAHVTDGPGRR